MTTEEHGTPGREALAQQREIDAEVSASEPELECDELREGQRSIIKREVLADETERRADDRENRLDDRQTLLDDRERRVELRELGLGHREHQADDRDRRAEERDNEADDRDRAADQREINEAQRWQDGPATRAAAVASARRNVPPDR